MHRGVIALLVAACGERVEHVHTTTITLVPDPIVVEREIVHYAMTAPHVACPPPRRDVPTTKPTAPPELVDSVKPSVTNSGWIAAWNTERAYVSTDAGATWTLVGRGSIWAVDFDCYGQPIVVREVPPGLDAGEDVVVLGGGPGVVLVGRAPPKGDEEVSYRARLAIRRGDSWEYKDLIEDFQSTEIYGRQYEDGSIGFVIQSSDCGGESASEVAIGRATSGFGEYAEIVNTEGRIEGIDHPRAYTGLFQGPSPVLVAEGEVYRYANGVARALPSKISTEVAWVGVDAAGRIWALACGNLFLATREQPREYCD